MLSASQNISSTTAPETPPLDILLVDDDETYREAVKRMLRDSKGESFQIDESDDFESALELISQNNYSACLIDYHLNDKTGLELLEAVKRMNTDSSIILLTGLEEESIATAAMEAGASDFLCKSDVSARLLERAIRYSVHHKKIGRQRDYLAHHDPLTGLVNRPLFFDRLNHQLERVQRQKANNTVLYMDIDAFKSINDAYGHEFGDGVLKAFSDRLVDCVRSTDTVARLGGDEFVVLLEDIDETCAHLVTQKILKAFDRPLIVDSVKLYATVSIGMKSFNSVEFNANQLLMQADQAMYVAKQEGKRTYRNFNASMQKMKDQNMSLEHDFLVALNAGHIVPHYQPKYCVKTGLIKGFEVLARWNHEERGFIAPNLFIPCAEKHSVILQLTESLLNQSCEDFPQLEERFPGVTISVNVSASICSNPMLINIVRSAIKKYSLKSSQLELEVTETAFMRDPEKSTNTLGEINASGVGIAIDDFGTGYSSLSYLTELPVDTLKIDMDFVQGIGVNPKKEGVVKVIIDLAKRLGFSVVAEGVETETQFSFLEEYGVDLVQGYYFSKPLSLADCLQLEPKQGRH